MNINDIFKTSDLPLASILELSNYPIYSLDRQESGKVIFSFKREEGLDNLTQAFWARQLQIEPIAYFESIKRVKSRLYN